MKRSQIIYLSVMLLMVSALLAGAKGVAAQNRLAFNRNNEAAVTGSVSRAQSRKYVFSAGAGQQISISLFSDSASSMRITVMSNATGKTLRDQSEGESGDMSEKTFNADLPSDGDYTITITSSDGAAAEFELRLKRN